MKLTDLFKKKKVTEAEAERPEVKKEKDPIDALIEEIIKKDKDINTILELRFFGAEDGMRIEGGGSRIAMEAFCELGPEYKQLFDECKVKFEEVAVWMNDRLVELGAESTRII